MRFFAFAFACLAAAPALAGKTKVAVHPVVVIGGGVKKDASEQMTKALLEELQTSDLSPLRAEEAARGQVAAKAVPKSASAAEGDLAEARRELERMHIPKAVQLLEAALRGMASDVANVADHGRFIDAELLLAEAFYRKGSEAQGRKALEAVARWAPDTVLDARRYPPVFVRAFEDVRSSVLAGPRGSVAVTSSPEGARVVFNGKAVGVTPLVIDDVIPGENHVVVRADDAEQRGGMVVQVEARRTADARMVLGESSVADAAGVRAGIAANRFDASERMAGLALARSVSADLVILLGIAEGDRLYQVGGFIGSTKTGRWAALPLLQVDADMLSASIEGGKLARYVGQQAKVFKASVADGTLPFIAGMAAAPAVARSTTNAGHVSFAGVVPLAAVAPVAAAAAVRPPMSDVRAPISDVRPPTSDVRQPISDVRDPNAYVRDGDTRQPMVASTDPSRVPVGERARPPEDDRLLTRSVAAEHLDHDSMVAANIAAIDGYSPLTDRNAMAVGQTVERDGITSKWWFWTAIGVGAAVVGGGTYYLVKHNHRGNTVSVQAAW